MPASTRGSLGKAKEGLSVYGVLNKCVSPPGKRLLRLWLLRPLVDVPALHARLDAVAYFLSHGEVVRSSLLLPTLTSGV